MKRLCLVVLASFLLIPFLTSSGSAMYHPTLGRWLSRDPIGYVDGTNKYEYSRSAPLRYTDVTGGAASKPGDSQQVDHWRGAADAVDARDWAKATAHMSALAAQARKAGGPSSASPGRACCCKGPDKDKCHIYVTHLGKVAVLVDATDGRKSVPHEAAGYPEFPTRSEQEGAWTVLSGKKVIAGVVTLVQVKHEEGKDTSGCWLSGHVQGVSWRDATNKSRLDDPDDFGGFFWHGNLNTAQASNWYIDTPIAPTTRTARFFQMHVTVLDEGRHTIEGLDAWYGWAYKVAVNTSNWEGGRFRWVIWPKGLRVAHQDPQGHVGPDVMNRIAEEGR